MPIDTDELAALNPDLQINPNHDFTVPNCYRSWSFHANTLGVGCLQVHNAKSYREDTRLEVLREVYSRAIFEVCIGKHFDNVDSKVDCFVLRHIRDMFGPETALRVHRDVASCGPVVRSADSCFDQGRDPALSGSSG